MSSVLTETAGRTIASAQPYPWPYHGSLKASGCALVVCLDGDWRAPDAQSDESDLRLARLARALRAAGVLIVAIKRVPRRAGASPELRPAQVAATLAELEVDVEVTAGATSGFYASPLDDVLRSSGRADLILAGWGLEGPVHSTLRAANDRGYECLLVADACSAIDKDLVFASSEMVRFSGGIFGAFADTAAVLDAFANLQAPRRSTQ